MNSPLRGRSVNLWRGIRFRIPGFDGPESGPGGGLGISPQGRLEAVSGRAAVRQALLLLLTTRPGERVMRPRYGCELSRLMFWPNDDTTAGLAIHYVQRAVARWEPRVDHLRVDAHPRPDRPGVLDVTLAYRVRSTGEEDRLAIRVDLGSGAV